MNIGYQIAYRTVWGESVVVLMTWVTKTGKKRHAEMALSTADGEVWRGETAVPSSAVEVEYEYTIVCEGETVRREWCVLPRTLALPKRMRRLQCIDRWRDQPEDTFLYTSAFTDTFVRHESQPWPFAGKGKPVTIRIMAPEVPEGQTLAVLGNLPALGDWQPERAVRLVPVGPAEWAFTLDLGAIEGTLEYKYLTLSADANQPPIWELHDNRRLPQLDRKSVV